MDTRRVVNAPHVLDAPPGHDDGPDALPHEHTGRNGGRGDVIRFFSNMTAISSAIEVNLTGQIVADSIGSRIYSGGGGQMNFVRGAALAPRAARSSPRRRPPRAGRSRGSPRRSAAARAS